MSKVCAGGNHNDFALLQALRHCLAPEISVTWASRGRDYYMELSCQTQASLFFNRSLGRKLGLCSGGGDGGLEDGGVVGQWRTTATPGATHRHGYRVQLFPQTIFRSTLPVNVIANLQFLYLGSMQSFANGGALELITQLTPTRPIMESRPNSMQRYLTLQQDFPRFFDILPGMHLVLLDSDFQLLECFHDLVGHCQVILDMF
jgi:hypothetical protein